MQKTLENALIVDGLVFERPPCYGGAHGFPPALLTFRTVFLAERFF